MAKRRVRRRFNLRRVRVSNEITLSTLASDTALTVTMTGASVSTYRAMSVKATWNLKTLAAADGLVTFGYAHSDYSVTEIKECLEAFAAIDPGDKIAQEQANRLVRLVGTFSTESEEFNNGRPITTRLNWLIPIGQNVNLFVFNEDTSALTSGAIVNHQGNLWVKDSV